ncbi:hypothetical protein EON79_11535 [bacterium]|nr:MAG: hypothetical protein EON79_11535 [bacterium]
MSRVVRWMPSLTSTVSKRSTATCTASDPALLPFRICGKGLLKMIAELKALDSALSLMGWDRQVLMPPGGANARTAHQQSLTAMRHALLTSDAMRRAAEGYPTLQREIALADALPEELVVRKARVANDAYEAWRQAKAENDFPRLAPYLQELFDIAREVSERRALGSHVYDGLIDLFEQGTTYADARRMFDGMKPRLVALVQQIAAAEPIPDRLAGEWDPVRLRAFAAETTAAIGFDFGRGRLDRCANAFCAGTTSGDVRMTTRSSDHLKGILSRSGPGSPPGFRPRFPRRTWATLGAPPHGWNRNSSGWGRTN